ncbi:MAG: rod shape-determining protein MreD [Fibrobacter sp.]|jgi:rod shape-determining protein MreD|nr:rod shape-determining protein MreD [Fibrobacter sp.]
MIWRILAQIFLFVMCAVLQTTVASWIEILGVRPDFFVIFIVFIALGRGAAVGALWGFIAGFSQDVYAPAEWLGAGTIAFTVLGFLVGLLEERFITLNLGLKIVVLAIGFFVSDFIYYLLIEVPSDSLTRIFLTISLPECIYTVLFATLVFYLFSRKNTKKNHVKG